MCTDLWHMYVHVMYAHTGADPVCLFPAQHSPLPFHYLARPPTHTHTHIHMHTCVRTHTHTQHTHLTMTPGCHSWSHPHFHPHTITPSHYCTLTLSHPHPHPTPSTSSTLSPMVQVDLTTDYQGFVRVHMCVTRPIHVSAGVTKNSWYGLMKPVRARSRRYARGKGKAPRRDAGRDCGDNEVCGGDTVGHLCGGHHWSPAVCLL